MKNTEFAIPEYITAEEIKSTRKGLGLTQKQFASLMRCSKPTVERWETSKEKITGPVVFAVFSLNRTHKAGYILPKRTTPLRLIYMHKQTVCTVIDVDDAKEQVSIVNYADHYMFRAFGNNEAPTYKDYEGFLEERCFPRERDKMKLILEDLDLPFYDPFMIIEKTEGRMAEDDFWLKVER